MPGQRKLRLSATLLLLSLMMLASQGAWAQESPDVTTAARELFVQAAKLTQEGKWEEARDKYSASLHLKRAAITLYSLGLAEKHTGQYVESLEHLRAFLAEPSTPVTKRYEAPAREAIADVEKRVAKIRITVEPSPEVPGLEVRLDGRPIPTVGLGAPRLVNPGKRDLTATALGYDSAKASVDLSEGQETTVNFALHPTVKQPEAPPPVMAATPPAPPPPASRSHAGPIAFMTIGGGMLAAGAVVGLIGVNAASNAPTSNGPEASSARLKMHVGDGLAVAGVTAVAIGVIWIVASGDNTSERARAAKAFGRGLSVAF